VVARKVAPKDENVLGKRIVHRAFRMLCRLHKCTKQQQLKTEFLLHVIQLSLIRFYRENGEIEMKNSRYFACGTLK